jgi:hypothetical protein
MDGTQRTRWFGLVLSLTATSFSSLYFLSTVQVNMLITSPICRLTHAPTNPCS